MTMGPAGGRSRGRSPAIAAIVVVAIVVVALGLTGLYVRAQRTGIGPIATGALIASPGPGQTPVLSADSVPLKHPAYPYVGSAPWQISTSANTSKVLEGYASKPSYLPGETLRLAVSTTAAAFDVTIWRVSGQERDGAPFHLMASAASVAGTRQAPPTIDPVTKMVAAAWSNTFSFPIPATWPSGVYLARLASGQRVQSYVPFVVRSTEAHAVLVVSSALNWEAYNDWGGSNVYVTRVGQPLPGVDRALAVSFDRPYAGDSGAGQLFDLEMPFLSWIDRQGLDVGYTTDYDLSISPDEQRTPRVVVFNGHDEYWGPRLYEWLDRHVTTIGDMSLAMFAADSGYWPVALRDPSADGPRSFVCLKHGPVPPELRPTDGSASPGPPNQGSGAPGSTGAAGPSAPPGDVEERAGPGITALGADGPYLGSFPGEPLFGVRYRGVTKALGRYTVAPGGADPRLLERTDLTGDASLGFIAGGEVDGVYSDVAFWGPLGGRYDHVFAEAAQITGRAGYRWTAQAVWRDLPSGGRVFSSGTFYWGWALDPSWGAEYKVPPGFGQLTLNILRFLANG
jgi:hypothetical protein